MTSREGVFAGGDVVHKPATVVLAMREAKKLLMAWLNTWKSNVLWLLQKRINKTFMYKNIHICMFKHNFIT